MKIDLITLLNKSDKRFEYVLKELNKIRLENIKTQKAVEKVINYLLDFQFLTGKEVMSLIND